MKTKNYLFLIIMAFAIGFISCEEKVTESCDGLDLSDDLGCPTTVDAVATFCSDGTSNSYYTYGGDKYSCTGVDESTCDAARAAISADLIEKGCSGKKSGTLAIEKLSSLAQNLLLEVRTQSLCN